MCLKIRCDGESEKFCKIFWKLNKALFYCLMHDFLFFSVPEPAVDYVHMGRVPAFLFLYESRPAGCFQARFWAV